jgi:hypothetical protein
MSWRDFAVDLWSRIALVMRSDEQASQKNVIIGSPT